jgi:hypothetical protein
MPGKAGVTPNSGCVLVLPLERAGRDSVEPGGEFPVPSLQIPDRSEGWGETSSRAEFEVFSFKFEASAWLETWDSQPAREDTRPTEVDPHEVGRWGRRESWEPRTECFQLLALRE